MQDRLAIEAQLQTAALQAVADACARAEAEAASQAERHATALARAVLATLSAALPALAAHHAEAELDAVIAALLPPLRRERHLAVRAHPAQADFIRRALQARAIEASVTEDGTLAEADLRVSWEEGELIRDTAGTIAALRQALAPLLDPIATETPPS